MAERRNERAGRSRPARSSRNHPPASRSASRRGRNPAPPRTESLTGATSLDLIDDDGLPDSAFDDGETQVIDAVVDDDGVAGDSVDGETDVDGDDRGGTSAAESSRRASPKRFDAGTLRRGRAPARALAARWHRLNPRRAIVLAVVLGFVALTLAMPLRTFFTQRAELDQVRAANAAIERENADLTRKVNQQGDPAYVEAQARARLQYVRPGETAFVLEVPGRARAEQERRRAAERAANPWYANLWDSVATPPAK